MEITGQELRLADVVDLFDGPYRTATVKQIRDGEVTFFRPYVASSDFEYTGGVICTIGIEEFKCLINTSHTYKLLQRKELK